MAEVPGGSEFPPGGSESPLRGTEFPLGSTVPMPGETSGSVATGSDASDREPLAVRSNQVLGADTPGKSLPAAGSATSMLAPKVELKHVPVKHADASFDRSGNSEAIRAGLAGGTVKTLFDREPLIGRTAGLRGRQMPAFQPGPLADGAESAVMLAEASTRFNEESLPSYIRRPVRVRAGTRAAPSCARDSFQARDKAQARQPAGRD